MWDLVRAKLREHHADLSSKLLCRRGIRRRIRAGAERHKTQHTSFNDHLFARSADRLGDHELRKARA